MRIYTFTRWFATIALFAYLILRFYTAPTWWSELFFYNLVAIGAIFSITYSPLPENRRGRFFISGALLAWTIGSISSSIDSFFPIELTLLSEISYLVFYPLAIYGAFRSLRVQESGVLLEAIDTLVIALGGTTLLSALVISSRWVIYTDEIIFSPK